MIILDKRLVVMLHEQLIRETGGSQGIRDEGLLESALSVPFQEFGGVSAYPTIEHKAARLGYGLAKNHAFIDGNKRIGAHAMLIFLGLNHIEVTNHQPCWWFDVGPTGPMLLFRLKAVRQTFACYW